MMSDNETGEKLVYTVPEAGKLLGISRATAYSLAHQGQIPVIRLGKRLVVPKCGLERMLNETRNQPQQHGQEKPISHR